MAKSSKQNPKTPTNTEYEPPKVWRWDTTEAGKWSGINRPTSGARTEQALPKGKHALQLYSIATPNGQKISIMLEELLELGKSGAEYDAFYIDIGKGDQFNSGFVEINPNSKIPALVDTSAGEAVRIFESGSILLYLAEKFESLLPSEHAARTETLNWLFWLHGAAPFLGGGFGHFYHYAPVKIEYAIDRFTMEVKRMMHVLEQQLQKHAYIAGDEYTIADISIWPWFGNLARGLQYNAGEFLSVDEYPALQAWAERIAQRPAVKRGRIVNRTWGPEEEQLKERHSADDFS